MQAEMPATTAQMTNTPDPGQAQFLEQFDAEIPVSGAMGRAPVSDAPIGMDEEQVSPEEQAQYDEFTSMALGLVHDLKKVGPNRAPADIILDFFKPGDMTVPKALGFATAEVCYTVHNFMKRQQVEIAADVIFHAAEEVMTNIYEVAAAARVIPTEKLPPDNSPQEEQLLGRALIYAVEQFAQKLQATGQLPREEAAKHLDENIRREAETGELDNWDPRTEVDPDGLNFALKRMQENGADKDVVAEFEAMGYPRMVDPREPASAGQAAAADGFTGG